MRPTVCPGIARQRPAHLARSLDALSGVRHISPALRQLLECSAILPGFSQPCVSSPLFCALKKTSTASGHRHLQTRVTAPGEGCSAILSGSPEHTHTLKTAARKAALKCMRMRKMRMNKLVPRGRASTDSQVPQECRAWGLAATWLHATAASYPGNTHMLWAGAGGSELPSTILQCPAGTPGHQPPSSPPMGPARATVRQPRRRASSCRRSSAASRSRRAAASASFCSCALACSSFSLAAELHECRDIRNYRTRCAGFAPEGQSPERLQG